MEYIHGITMNLVRKTIINEVYYRCYYIIHNVYTEEEWILVGGVVGNSTIKELVCLDMHDAVEEWAWV